jgi:serine/threonine protein kinase
LIGEQVGNFRIAALLGKGGMGEVYLAEHQVGTRVAIKMLLPHVSANETLVQRFFNEAIAVGQIQHAGIGRIFDSGTHAGRAYLVMELLPGETLAARIRRSGRLSIAEVGELGKQIAGVLEAVDRAGITHRDLKPDNIFIVPDDELGERIKIVDFGIAKLTGVGGGMTATTTSALGTPAYMSPEQWKNAKHVDWRADAYSLGCLVFEMVAGRPPFIAETIGEACAKHLTEDAPRLASIVDVPGPLDALVASLLEKSPDRRPASLRDIALAFAAIGEQASTGLPAMRAVAPSALPLAGQGPTQVSMIAPSPLSGTTLGSASGQLPSAPRKRSVGTWIAVALGTALAATIAVLVVVMTRSEDRLEPEERVAVPVANPPPERPVERPPENKPAVPASALAEPALPASPRKQPRDPARPGSGSEGRPGQPQPAVGELVRITTNPPNATIKIDGQVIGQSPAAVRLAPGAYRVTLRSPANEFAEKRIVVEQGRPFNYAYTFPAQRSKTELPLALQSAEISNTIAKQVQPKIFACRSSKSGKFYPLILVTVLPTGQISEVRDVSQPSERGKCLVGAIRDVKFPPTQRGGSARIPYS